MENNLDINLFDNEPIIDIGAEDINPFLDENEEQDETIENDSQENNNTNEDQLDSENVVGNNDNQDETEGESADKDNADNSSSDPNLFNSITALLVEKDLLSVDSDVKVENEEDFVELFRKEIQKSQEERFNDRQKEYLKKLEEGIPQTVIEKHDTEIAQLESITEDVLKEDSNLRQRVIYQDFVNRGYSDEKARKLLQRSIELEEDVNDSLEAIVSIKETALQKQNAERQALIEQESNRKRLEEERINKIKEKIQNSTEVIKDFKLTDSVKAKVEKNMFDIVSTNPETNTPENILMKVRRENQEDFDFKLYYLFTITDGFKNFDSLTKATNSKVVKDLEKAFKSNTKIKDPGSPAYLQDPESYSIDIAGHEIVVD